MSKAKFADIFKYDDCDTYWTSRVSYITSNCDTNKEVLISNKILIEASNLKEAHDRIIESLKGLISDIEITEIIKSNIMDIFPFENEQISLLDSIKEAEKGGQNESH